MKSCILHAGTVKTGTTTLQSFLSSKRKELSQAGVLFSRSMGRSNHTSLAAYAQSDETFDDLRFARGVTEAEQVFDLRETIRRDLSEEAFSCDEDRVLFSSEHTSSRLQTEEEVVNLRSLLRSEFTDIKIIFYLRLQDEMALSTYSTGIRNGELKPFDLSNYKSMSRVLNYDNLLKRWEDVFGVENITVRLFDREIFAGGSLIKDFLQAINVDIDLNEEDLKTVKNQSYDIDTLEYLRLLNHHLPRFNDDGTPNVERGAIGQIVENISRSDNKPRMTADQRATILKRFEASNASVFARYGLSEDYEAVLQRKLSEPAPEHAVAKQDTKTLMRLFAQTWAMREREVHNLLQGKT